MNTTSRAPPPLQSVRSSRGWKGRVDNKLRGYHDTIKKDTITRLPLVSVGALLRLPLERKSDIVQSLSPASSLLRITDP